MSALAKYRAALSLILGFAVLATSLAAGCLTCVPQMRAASPSAAGHDCCQKAKTESCHMPESHRAPDKKDCAPQRVDLASVEQPKSQHVVLEPAVAPVLSAASTVVVSPDAGLSAAREGHAEATPGPDLTVLNSLFRI